MAQLRHPTDRLPHRLLHGVRRSLSPQRPDPGRECRHWALATFLTYIFLCAALRQELRCEESIMNIDVTTSTDTVVPRKVPPAQIGG